MPHPVRFIGWLIQVTENFLRRITISENEKGRPEKEIFAGGLLTIVIVSASFFLVYFILEISKYIHPVLFHLLNIYFMYSALATRCLAKEAHKVYVALIQKDIPKARKRLSMLVGRDTEKLTETEITRGVVETTAENLVDGVISPLIFIFIGTFFSMGAPLVYAFKAISTLDSMVGYKNARYNYFGRISARTDDVANFLSARFSGVIIPLSGFFCGLGFFKSFHMMLRDRKNHKSPNCAYPEAAVAGALGVLLGGTNSYFGEMVEKPTIGDALVELSPKHITTTIKMMVIASILTLLLGVMVGFILYNIGVI